MVIYLTKKIISVARSTKVTRLSEVSQFMFCLNSQYSMNFCNYFLLKGTAPLLALKYVDWLMIGMCKFYFLSSIRQFSLEKHQQREDFKVIAKKSNATSIALKNVLYIIQSLPNVSSSSYALIIFTPIVRNAFSIAL